MTDLHRNDIVRARQLASGGDSEAAVALLDGLLRASPDDPDLLFALGVIARSAGLLDEADKAFRAVLDQRPNTVEAVVNLAGVLVAKGNPAPAITILRRLHQATPALTPAALGLAAALLAAEDLDGALAVYDRLLGQRPDLAQAHANRAEVLNRLGRYPEAFVAIEAAYRLAPVDPRVALNRAFALLMADRLEEGYAAYEARLEPALPSAPLRRNLEVPRWTAGPPPGLLLVAAEQGLGDELRFAASVARLLALGAGVIVEVEPRLVGLFRRSLPEASVVPYDRRRSGVRPIFDYGWLADAAPAPDAWIEAGSLPLRLGPPRTEPIAPGGYLTPDPDRVTAFRDRLRAGAPASTLVGIVWGSSRQGSDRSRYYAPLDAWGPILGLSGFRFVDLQYTASGADRAAIRDRFGVEVTDVDFLDKRNDLDGAAALAASLDAVVGMSSSVTVLAGASGTPTIEILRERAWLPKVGGRDGYLGPIRLVEAEPPGNWRDAMERAAALLVGLAGSGRPA